MSAALGLLLLLVGAAAALRWGRHRPDSPQAAWHPDPYASVRRDRFWDGRTCDAPPAGLPLKTVVGRLTPFVLYGVVSRGRHPR